MAVAVTFMGIMSTVDGGGLSMKWWSGVSTCTSIMCGSDSKGLRMYFMDKDKSNTYCMYTRTLIFYSTTRAGNSRK